MGVGSKPRKTCLHVSSRPFTSLHGPSPPVHAHHLRACRACSPQPTVHSPQRCFYCWAPKRGAALSLNLTAYHPPESPRHPDHQIFASGSRRNAILGLALECATLCGAHASCQTRHGCIVASPRWRRQARQGRTSKTAFKGILSKGTHLRLSHSSHSLSLLIDSPLLRCMSRTGSAERHHSFLDLSASTFLVRQRRQGGRDGNVAASYARDPACQPCQPHLSLFPGASGWSWPAADLISETLNACPGAL